MPVTTARRWRHAVLVLCVLLVVPLAVAPQARADDPVVASAAMSTLPVDDDVAWCAFLLGQRRFASAAVNLRKLVSRVDLPNGDVRLSVQITARNSWATLPSTLVDCVWVDLNNDQRFQISEPTSLVLLINPSWEQKGDDTWKLEFDHLVPRGGRATVCDRVSGVSVDRDDQETFASFHGKVDRGDVDRGEVARHIDDVLGRIRSHVLRSNRVCSPRLGTPVSEAPMAALLGVAGVAVVGIAGLLVRRRRGPKGPSGPAERGVKSSRLHPPVDARSGPRQLPRRA